MSKFVLSLSTLLLAGCLAAQAVERPAKWAAQLETRSLKNAYQLDKKVFRSAQPSRKGFKEAKQLGITDVLNLRDKHSDKSKANGLGLNLHVVKVEADDINEQEIVEALRIIRSAQGPILVHCWHGSDRTGAVCAAYRIVFNSWSKEEAIDELVNGGFGYHKMYANIIKLIHSFDVPKIKKQIFAP
jgi:protein tyrosine/serine phosphatase